MRKELLSISIIAMMFASPCLSFANENYTMIEPVYQEVPAVSQQSQYQTQYPLPINSYQTQGFEYQNQNYNYNDNNLQGNIVYVPANTIFEAVSMSPISSETASKLNDFSYGKEGQNQSFIK